MAPHWQRSKPPKEGHRYRRQVVHPLDPSWELPVYVANFVLMDYGTGAIFGCPSGDQRDLDFARKYGLPVVAVVAPEGPDAASFTVEDTAFTDDGVMINSGFLNGMKTADAFEAVVQKLSAEMLGNAPQAERKVNFRLRDWGISASVTGVARSRSFIAKSAAWCRFRKRTCRSSCPMM